MTTIAAITFSPGSLIAWLIVGLIAGWLDAWVMKGGGYGLVGDMLVGVIGAVTGGWVYELIATGEPGIWGSIGVAMLGAWILIALFRFLGFGRPAI
jgi:uncharacterized membrane protein YeaQ/YmgE (transglycosylase-associated protein family)